MSKLTKALTAAAGNAGESLYVEDVFSTYLYTGNGTSQTITNGIDLSGEGGLTWFKDRNTAQSHVLIDSERGTNKTLFSNETRAEATQSWSVTYNSDGMTLPASAADPTNGIVNFNTYVMASWTFRKAEKFFDVVTYTGDGVAGRTVAHNLGSVPAVIITKKTSGTSNWAVNDPSQANPWSGALLLNTADAFVTSSTVWNDTAPTDSVFTVGTADATNTSGQTYVAYLFASDAGGFGDDGSESIIKCGSYVGTGSATVPNHVELGFEPQYWIFKNTTRAADWWCIDTMRGADYSGTARLFPNTSSAEVAAAINVVPTATGFDLYNNNDSHNKSGDTYIYIAIRRPMKTPESGTEVFSPIPYNGNGVNSKKLTAGSSGQPITPSFVDLSIIKNTDATESYVWSDRLRGGNRQLRSNTTAAEETETDQIQEFDLQNGIQIGNSALVNSGNGAGYIGYMLKRATGFMDVVAYTGDGVSGRQIPHNLTVTPQFAITKGRSSTTNWWNFYYPTGQVRTFNSDAFSNWGITASSTWFEGDPSLNNISSQNYIAYLFATVAGVSKVGSVVHSSTTNVDCGFSAGARFVMVKRTDATGDWYYWDSARGIVAGNDPYLLLNTTAAEVTNTDYIDPLSSGFTLTSSFTAGTYIFLAIA